MYAYIAERMWNVDVTVMIAEAYGDKDDVRASSFSKEDAVRGIEFVRMRMRTAVKRRVKAEERQK